MPALLPTDILAGLNQTNILDPIQAAQARTVLQQTQLRNLGIPAQNEQTVLQNTGLENQNQRYAAETPDVLAQLQQKTKEGAAEMPVHELAGAKASVGLDFLRPLMGGQAFQQETNGQGPLQSLMNPAPQAPGSALTGMVNPQQGESPLRAAMRLPLKEFMAWAAQPGARDAMGEYFEPALQQKQMEAFAQLRPQLDAIKAKALAAGGDLKKAGYNNLASALAAAIPPELQHYPAVSDYLKEADKLKPDMQFNPAIGGQIQQRDINSLREMSKLAAKKYVDSRDIMTTVIPEYQEYKKDPTGPFAKQLQQSLLDKFVQMSINKSPTEAQYEISQAFPGLKTYIDQASGKLMFGQIVPEQTIDGIVKIMSRAGIERGQNLKTMNDNIEQQAILGGVDPARVHFIPNSVVSQDSTAWSGLAGQKAAAGGAKPMKEWKAGDERINSAGTPMVFDGAKWSPKK